MRALLIRHPFVDKVLAGTKTWEIRGTRTTIRETIALIASGSGTVIGVCDLVDCIGPLTKAEYRKNARKAGIRPSEARGDYYKRTYAWVVKNPDTQKARALHSPERRHYLGDARPEGRTRRPPPTLRQFP